MGICVLCGKRIDVYFNTAGECESCSKQVKNCDTKNYITHRYGMGIDFGYCTISGDNENIVNDLLGRPMYKTVIGHGQYSFSYIFDVGTSHEEIERLSKLYYQENEEFQKQQKIEADKRYREEEYIKAKQIIKEYEDGIK